VSEKFRGKSKRGLYGDTIEELDTAIGDIFAELKNLGLDDNTLVVFTSDNGPWTDKQIGDHGGSPLPFRGAKMTTWEGGWRVPGIVRWPGKVRAGETSDGIAATIDLLPTFAALSGAKLPAAKLDGLDLTDFLSQPNASSPRETFLYHNGARLTAVRHKDFKLVFARPVGSEMPYMPNFVSGHIESLPQTQLFQLSADPTESTDLSAKRPAVVKLLAQLADESRADLGDFTGPGTGAHFFDEGPRWPLPAEPKLEHPKRRQQAK
jgi:arylsulfatase A-like enzyme